MFTTPFLFLLAFCLSYISAFGSNCGGQFIDTREPEDFTRASKPLSDFKVAFFGDQDLGTGPLTVLQQISQWGAHAVFHSGDFDYHDDPAAFFALRDSVFAEGFPYLTTIGNHELVMWNEGYESGLAERMKSLKNDTDVRCWGQIGVNMACNFGGERGLVVIMSGVGTCGTGHEAFLEETLRSFPKAQWKLCMWHKVQHLYQTSDNEDETGYGVYDTCRRHGAIVMTAHTHSYSRTVVMSDFANQGISNPEKTNLHISPGRTFAVVSGIGGHKVSGFVDDLEANPWWASNAAQENGTDFGALYCTLNVNGVAGAAECFLQDITGVIWDKFTIQNDYDATTSVAPASQCFEKRDVQIQSAIDENHSRRTSSSLLVISSPGSSSISLTFRNLNISSSSNVTHAYLQLLCANAFLGNMTYEMQMRDPLSGYESQRAFYSTKVTEDLSGELWLSSNMSHLLMDIVSSSNALFIQDIELTMTAVGDIRHAYSFTSSPHLAPSLYVQMTNFGHC